MTPTDVTTIICDQQAKSLKIKQLSPEILQLAYEQKWFKIWVPKSYGGLELSLLDGCKLLEELAYWDGSLAWTVTLCSGANMFVGFVDPAPAERIFADPYVCFGGSGRVGGKAVKVAGGYQLYGKWSYATGAPHLTHFTANAHVFNGDDPDAKRIKSFFIHRDDVLIHYDWDTFGLESTASHSFSIINAFVPDEQSFDILPEAAIHPSLLFQYPFKPFAELTLFVNYLGIYNRFCDLVHKEFHQRALDESWADKYAKEYFKQLDQAQSVIEDAHVKIYGLIEKSWDRLSKTSRDHDDDTLYEDIAIHSRDLIEKMKGNIVNLFPKCGIKAAQYESELNIVFRNFFTATQHALLNVKE